MNVLVDTCTFLWLHAVLQLLLRPETQRFCSAAAAWEIAIKWSLGRLALPAPPQNFMRRLRTDSLVESLPIDEASALQVAKLPNLHRDPFDRIQISQSIQHGLILVTPDPLIRQYAVRTMWE